MRLRKSIATTIQTVLRAEREGRITHEQSDSIVKELKDLNEEYRGVPRKEFEYHFIFWGKWHVYDILYPPKENMV